MHTDAATHATTAATHATAARYGVHTDAATHATAACLDRNDCGEAPEEEYLFECFAKKVGEKRRVRDACDAGKGEGAAEGPRGEAGGAGGEKLGEREGEESSADKRRSAANLRFSVYLLY